MIKKLTDKEIEDMSVEELETEFKNIYKEKEFGGAAKTEINLPDATGKQIKFIDLFAFLRVLVTLVQIRISDHHQ